MFAKTLLCSQSVGPVHPYGEKLFQGYIQKSFLNISYPILRQFPKQIRLRRLAELVFKSLKVAEERDVMSLHTSHVQI